MHIVSPIPLACNLSSLASSLLPIFSCLSSIYSKTSAYISPALNAEDALESVRQREELQLQPISGFFFQDEEDQKMKVLTDRLDAAKL